MYEIIMITAVTVVAIGWIAYGIWRIKIYYEEKNKPKPKSERLQKTQKSFEEYLEKMKEFGEKKPYERKSENSMKGE